MNKEKIKEKLLLEKNSKLIDILEIAGTNYAKTLEISREENLAAVKYKYYKIVENSILDLKQEELEEISRFFEINLGNIVY